MVDEVAGLGSPSATRSPPLETVQVPAQNPLDLGGGGTRGGWGRGFGRRALRGASLCGFAAATVCRQPQPPGLEDAGHIPDDLHMPLEAVGHGTQRV